MRNRLICAVLAAALLCGAVAYAGESDFFLGGSTKQDRAHAERRAEKIKVSGHIRGLYPGAAERMRVRVRNRLNHRITLKSVRVRVKDASSGCDRGYLSVRRFRSGVKIAAKKKTRVRVRVRMASAATDACQGARFPLRFRARVRR